MTASTDLRYPIGKYEPSPQPSAAERDARTAEIERAPGEVRRAVRGLGDARLDTPYRPGGWTVRQVVHHLADSHLNAYVRFKLAVTEDEPTIKPYDEQRWAVLDDSRLPVEPSLLLLDGLHARWVALLRSLSIDDLSRRLRHPDHAAPLTLWWMLGLYAWHGRHHVAHITALREREQW